jgi:hypothetical protein
MSRRLSFRVVQGGRDARQKPADDRAPCVHCQIAACAVVVALVGIGAWAAMAARWWRL